MTNAQKIIRNKLGLLKLGETLGNVSQACKVMGYSRDSFYRFKELYETGGEAGLQELSRKKPNPANRVESHIEQAVVEFATDRPAYGQVRVSNELKQKGILISPGGVRGVWLRHNLETFPKRLKALEIISAKENYILTEAQVVALEKARVEKESHGEIETHHPGYLGSQDTFFVGTLKGVGRIYQQTFVDTYSKVAFAKLYTQKTALCAADTESSDVLPFYEAEGVRLLRILTDRGTEYCGTIEHHEYQLYLAVEDIDHTRTKARSPQTNGICERFHRTILEEFYQVAFRKKIYTSLEQLQADVDLWLIHYNTERPHSGKQCNGRTPIATWEAGKQIARDKMLDQLFGLVENEVTQQQNCPIVVS
jgi:hypothetical protein